MFEEETFETTFRLFVLSSAVQETEEQHVIFFFFKQSHRGSVSSLWARTGQRCLARGDRLSLRNPVLLVGRQRLSKVATNSCRLKQKSAKRLEKRLLG